MTKLTKKNSDDRHGVTKDEARLMAWSLRECHDKIRKFEYWMASMGMKEHRVFNDALELASRLETFAMGNCPCPDMQTKSIG